MRIVGATGALVVGALMAGCGQGAPTETAHLVVESSTTTTTAAPTTTTTVIPVTTTTVAPVTTTTTAPRPTTTTTVPRKVAEPVTTTTTKAAPWCTAQAMSGSVVKGTPVVVLVSSNLPGRVASSTLKPSVATMDPNGMGSFTVTAPGGYMDQFGHYSPKTNQVRVDFYAQTPTANQLLGGTRPALLASCKTSYVSVG